MRLVTALTGVLLTLVCLGLARGQDAKVPAKAQDKANAGKNDPGNQEDPLIKDKKDDKKDEKKDDKKDDKKTDKKKDDKKTVPATPKFSYWQTFGGKLTTIGQNGDLTIQISGKVKTAYDDAQQRLLNWQKDIYNRQMQMLQEKNPQTRYTLYIELQKVQAKPPELYYLKDVSKDVVVKQAKDMKIRVAYPEVQYDEKGQPIPFTKDKIKQLVGPEGYPGFPTETVTLQTNQTVQVFLARPEMKDPKKKPKGPDIADIVGGGNNKDNPPAMDEDPTVPRAIVIVIINDKQ